MCDACLRAVIRRVRPHRVTPLDDLGIVPSMCPSVGADFDALFDEPPP